MLVVLAHPDLASSRANRRLAETAAELEYVEVHDLYAAYPTFDVDMVTEHDRIRRHDQIVVQHPLYWYSSPALLKQWIDVTLTPGFAYGKNAAGTRGKVFSSAVTCGAPERAYEAEGWNHYTVRELLKPFEATAMFCNMTYADPFVGYDTYSMDDTQLAQHCNAYASWLGALTAGFVSGH